MADPYDLKVPFRSRMWNNLIRDLGTTTLSVVIFGVFIPVAVVVGSAIYEARQPRKPGVSVVSVVRDSVFSAPTMISSGITLFSWACLFLWASLKTVKTDKQCLFSVIGEKEKDITLLTRGLEERGRQYVEAANTSASLTHVCNQLREEIKHLTEIIAQQFSRLRERLLI